MTEVGCSGFTNSSWETSRRVAQPFVATGTGKITSARFDVRGISAGTPFGIEIRTMQNGVPTAEVLGTTFGIDTPAVSPGDPPCPAVASFDPKVPVMQGVTYALVNSGPMRSSTPIWSIAAVLNSPGARKAGVRCSATSMPATRTPSSRTART